MNGRNIKPIVITAKRHNIQAGDDKDEIKACIAAVNSSASLARGAWLGLNSLLAYLLIAISTTTHLHMLEETPQKLPILGVDIPLLGFYGGAPFLLLVIHLYALLNANLLARRINDFAEKLSMISDRKKRDNYKSEINPFIISLAFLYYHDKENRFSTYKFLIQFASWIILVGGPLLILLYFQVSFLPYHSTLITWLHRIAIIIDLLMIYNLYSSDYYKDIIYWRAWRIKKVTLILCCISIFLLVFLVLVFPTEYHYKQSYARNFFDIKVNEVKGIPASWHGFSNILVLPDKIISGQSKETFDGLQEGEYVKSYRGRNLAGAILMRTYFIKVDFTGADLSNANLHYAKLYESKFECAKTGKIIKPSEIINTSKTDVNGNEIKCTNLEGAILNYTELGNAQMQGAEMQGAILGGAQMQGANLREAKMQGAELRTAQMQGANLREAEMQGADLRSAQMQGANLFRAQMQGADLFRAQMQGAVLSWAQMQGADLFRTQMQGAVLREAQMQGAELRFANMDDSYMEGSYLYKSCNDDMTKTDNAVINKVRLEAILKPSFREEEDISLTDTQDEIKFLNWRDKVLNEFPEGGLKEKAKARLDILNPLMPTPDCCDRGFWQDKVKDKEYTDDELSAIINKYLLKLNSRLVELACKEVLAAGKGIIINRVNIWDYERDYIIDFKDKLLHKKLTKCPNRDKLLPLIVIPES